MSDTYRKHLPRDQYDRRVRTRRKLRESHERGGKSPAADRKLVRASIRSLGAIHDVDRHSL